MNIVLHSSDSFSSVLAVSIISILENNSTADEIFFFVIENNISEEHKKMIEQIISNYQNSKIIFIQMPNINEEYKLGLKMIKSIWLFDSYCRLFLGSILPNNIERVLYLDCDTLCNGNLTEFYNTELDNYISAGVIDCLSEKYYNLFGMDKSSYYCNSGVLLLDLKKWREENIEKKVIEFVQANKGYIFFMEQSVMNIILQNRIKIVHPRFNTYTLMIAFTYKNLQRLRKCERYYTKQEIDEAIKNPVIIHLTNCFYVKGRPWIENSKHPFASLFMKYRELTPWKDEPLSKDRTSWTQKYIFNIIRLLPQSIACMCVGYIYNVWRINHIERKM